MGQLVACFVHNGISYVSEKDYKALGNRLVLKDFDLADLRHARDECVADRPLAHADPAHPAGRHRRDVRGQI